MARNLQYGDAYSAAVETPAPGDLKVESFSSAESQAGTFRLELSLKDIGIGTGSVDEKIMQANLAKVFSIEGSTSLAPESFSLTNVVYSFGMPLDGKVTVEAKSADETAGRFFMRAKINY